MTIDCGIPPHTDSDIKVTINFYIRTDNCRTVYYKLLSDNPKKYQIENQTNGFIFDKNDDMLFRQTYKFGNFSLRGPRIGTTVDYLRRLYGDDYINNLNTIDVKQYLEDAKNQMIQSVQNEITDLDTKTKEINKFNGLRHSRPFQRAQAVMRCMMASGWWNDGLDM